MSPIIAGALISGASSIIGGASSQRQSDKYAKNQVQWRVADAQKAGIHPLAALGMNPVSPTGLDIGSSLASSGQDIGRAVMSGQTKAERDITTQSAMLGVRRQELENELLQSQIAQMNSAQLAPPIPSGIPAYTPPAPGQLVEMQPQQVTMSHPQAAERTTLPVPEITLGRTANGYVILPSEDAAEGLESAGGLSSLQFWLRNNLIPALKGSPPTTMPDDLQEGQAWRYNLFTGEWHPGESRKWYKPWTW